MPKSLKRVAEVDTFDFGRSVTDVISYAKNMSKTVNGLIDQIEYLQSRKKQEEQDLERLMQEKGEVIKLKAELTDKIIEKKSEFLEFVGSKQREIETKEANATQLQAEIDARLELTDKNIKEKENELEMRSTELEKTKSNLREEVKQELRQDIEMIEKQKTELNAYDARLTGLKLQLDKQDAIIVDSYDEIKKRTASLDDRERLMSQKESELKVRETKITETEQKIADTRKGITQAVADIENQISLIKRERDKNASDKKAYEDALIALNKRQSQLDIRQTQLNDRDAIQSSR